MILPAQGNNDDISVQQGQSNTKIYKRLPLMIVGVVFVCANLAGYTTNVRYFASDTKRQQSSAAYYTIDANNDTYYTRIIRENEALKLRLEALEMDYPSHAQQVQAAMQPHSFSSPPPADIGAPRDTSPAAAASDDANANNRTNSLRAENELLKSQLKALQDESQILRDASKEKEDTPPPPSPPPHNTQQQDDFAFDYNDLNHFEHHGCFPVRDICTTGYEWFYKAKMRSTLSFQPSFSLRHELSHNYWKLPFQEMHVNNSFFYDTDLKSTEPNAPACQMSSIPNHIIVTSSYIDMAVEAYGQIIIGLWRIWNSISSTTTHWWKDVPSNPHVQFYALTRASTVKKKPKSEATVMSSLQAFMTGFSSRPVENYLMSFHDESLGCQCFERLIFCGFVDADEEDRKQERKKMSRDPNYNSTLLDKIPKNSPVKHLKPGSSLGDHRWRPNFTALNAHVRQGAFDVYPNIAGRADEFKQNAIFTSLDQLNNNTNSYDKQWIIDHLQEWTMIGFSQRRVRRRWLNLNQTLDFCNHNWLVQHKVVCVEVNLDTPFGADPQNQVVMHAALDALIGVHGSQNVHSVWMPDGAYSLEILPHLRAKFGGWTQHTDQPTCNGKMNVNTMLNHIGYGLNETSVPNCTSAEWKHVYKCQDDIRWAPRDFLVPTEMIQSFVEKFLILSSGGTVTTTAPRMCDEFDELAQQEFVLYNIACTKDEATGTITQKQYYRERTSFAHLDK